MTSYEKLALSEEQNNILAEFEKAYKKCRDAGIAFVETETTTYAINDKDVYDFDCAYDDYSVREIDVQTLRKINLRNYQVECGHEENCLVSFFSTVFTCKGITH